MLTARYHEQKYGEPLVYGEGDPTGLLSWAVMVDWDNDHLFDGSNESVRMVGFESFRGRKKLIKKFGSGFEVIAPGMFSFTLRNNDGRYDQYNTSSDLYPYVTTGIDVKIEVTDQQDGFTKYSVIRGIIEDIVPDYYKEDRVVKFYCVDTSSRLQKVSARIPVTTDIAPEDAIALVLDDVNWPAEYGRSLGVSGDLMDYYWSNSKAAALTEIQNTSDSFIGYFFSDNEGRAKFTPRTDASTSVLDFVQDTILRDIGNNTLYDNLRNVTRMLVHPRSLSALTAVYQLLGNKPSLDAGASETIFGDYSYNGASVPAMNLVTPLATTDYTANTQADGLGTDKTANITVTFTNFGDSCKLVVTNNDAGTVYITKLQVRGYALFEQNASELTYPQDVTGITEKRELILDMLKLQDVNLARSFVNVFGLFASTPNPTPTIIVEARPSIQFKPDLFEPVTSTIQAIGINGVSFRVSGIGHKTIVDNCQAVRTTFYLEPYISGDAFWTWPVTDFGTDTIFGW